MRKAIAAAAEAGIARDALLAREGALEAEISALQQRQVALDSELLAGSEARATAAGLQAALAAASNEAAGLRGQVRSCGIPVHHHLQLLATSKAPACLPSQPLSDVAVQIGTIFGHLIAGGWPCHADSHDIAGSM